jgi:hypothetical protein
MGNTCSNYRKENDQEIVFASLEDKSCVSIFYDKFKIPDNLKKIVKLQKLFRKNKNYRLKAADSNFLGKINSIPESFTKAKSEIQIQHLSNLLSITKTVDLSIDSYRAQYKNHIQTEEFSSVKNSICERQFETEKFIKTFENFFISNSYKSTRHARNYSLPNCMTESPPTKDKSCENLVTKILYTEREKSQYLQEELRKAILLLKVFNFKEDKMKLLIIRNYFNILKDKSKKNIILLRQESIRKIQNIKLTKIKNILTRLLEKKVFKYYEVWKINTISISNKRSIANIIIKNFIIFSNKYNLQKYFQYWSNMTKIQGSNNKNVDKLKFLLISKVFNNYWNKENIKNKKEAFNLIKSNLLDYISKIKKVCL